MMTSAEILNDFKLCEEPVKNFNDLLGDFKYIKSNKKINYLNVAIAFDIESTSFYDEVFPMIERFMFVMKNISQLIG